MTYTRLAKAIALTMPLTLLAACTSNDSTDSNSGTTPPPSSNGPVISFDPEHGVVPFPSDIFGFDEDGTLHIPGESEWNTANSSEPVNAYWNYMGTQEGWGTSIPIVINLEMPENNNEESMTPLNESTLKNGVRLFFENEHSELQELSWNQDFRAIIGENGTLNIEPLKPFKEQTRYYLVLTKTITDTNGESIQPSSSYLKLLEGNDPTAIHLQQVNDKLIANGIEENSIAYSADFTTTSILNTLRPVATKYLKEYSDVHFNAVEEDVTSYDKNTLASQGLVNPALEPHLGPDSLDHKSTDTEQDNYKVLRTSINLPYFLDSPEYGKNCDYYPGMKSGIAPSNPNEYIVNPAAFCPGAFSYWQSGADQPSGLPITAKTAGNLYPFNKNNKVDVLITIPKDVSKRDPVKGFKTFIYIHGFNMDKESARGMASVMAEHGYAVIAIDHPVHGSRSIDIDNDGNYEINATGNGMDFAMPNNVPDH